MKKVLFLITKSNFGGAQRYVFDLATNLDPLAFQPIVAFGGSGELAERLTDAGIKTTPVVALARDISLGKELRAMFEIWRIVRRERPDVLHINSSKAGIYGALIGRLCRVPRIIFTAHGWAFNEDRPVWQKVIFKTMHWLTVLLSHQTIAVSAALKSQLAWPGTKKRMQVVRLGRSVPQPRLKDDARQLIEMRATGTEFGLVDFHDDVWLGSVAELHPVKNLNIAIEAVASLVHAFPRLRYIIIGEGEQRAVLETQIAHFGLEAHVILVGALPEAARLIPAFDIFLIPSRSEAAAYVALEAGLSGVPVIASNVGGIPELITDRVTGRLVPAGNVDALTTAIAELLRDQTEAGGYAAALKHVAEERTLERMVSETTNLYHAA